MNISPGSALVIASLVVIVLPVYLELSDDRVDFLAEIETCGLIRDAWFDRMRRHADGHELGKLGLEVGDAAYFSACAVRVSGVSISAITGSMPEHKGVECQLLMEAAQAATKNDLAEIRVLVRDFDKEHWFYSEARCAAER